MKIYTKTGDDGTTGLVGGSRVSKADPRIECYGTVDELNAAIGLAAVNASPELLEALRQVQANLFVIGSHLASPPDSPHRASLPKLDEAIVERLEKAIDATTARLPALVSSGWPAKSRAILPTSNPATQTERVWAPILAYLLLRALPDNIDGNSLDLPALFDRLHLRRALADIFASFGLEGEARWQAAAQVRLLLTSAAAAPHAIQTPALFHDPDARWLAGVHDSGGITYFNKEQFEELTTWLQLPALMNLARHGNKEPADLASRMAHLDSSVAAAYTAARVSGYRLTEYLTPVPTPKLEPTTR